MTVDGNHADDTNDRAELSAFDALKADRSLIASIAFLAGITLGASESQLVRVDLERR